MDRKYVSLAKFGPFSWLYSLYNAMKMIIETKKIDYIVWNVKWE